MKRSNISLFLMVLVCVISQKAKALPFAENDSTAIPFSALYQNTWGGKNTCLTTNILNKTQNYVLPLQIDSSNFVFPTVRKTLVCSPYGIRSGRMHTGMDIKQNLGDSIVSVWDGIVRMANKSYYGYGGTIVIRHFNGLETLYAHLSKIEVEENQVVKAGELIGYAGRTGRASTEHLHFETRFLYEHFDPRTIIDFTTFSLKTDTLYVRKGKFLSHSTHSILENTEEQISDTAVITNELEEEEPLITEQKISTKTSTKTISSPKTTFYTVQKGDTLYAISKKTNVSIDVLCKINNIKPEGILQIGQKLKLVSN